MKKIYKKVISLFRCATPGHFIFFINEKIYEKPIYCSGVRLRAGEVNGGQVGGCEVPHQMDGARSAQAQQLQ